MVWKNGQPKSLIMTLIFKNGWVGWKIKLQFCCTKAFIYSTIYSLNILLYKSINWLSTYCYIFICNVCLITAPYFYMYMACQLTNLLSYIHGMLQLICLYIYSLLTYCYVVCRHSYTLLPTECLLNVTHFYTQPVNLLLHIDMQCMSSYSYTLLCMSFQLTVT